MICLSQERGYEAFVGHSPSWNSRDISLLVQLSDMDFASVVKGTCKMDTVHTHSCTCTQIHPFLSSTQIASVQGQSHFSVDHDWGVFEKCFMQGGVDTAETKSLTGLRAFAALSFKKLYYPNSDHFPFLYMFPFKCLWSMPFPPTVETETVRTRRSTGILSMIKDIYFSLLTDAIGL